MVMFQSHWKSATKTKKRTIPSGMIRKRGSMMFMCDSYIFLPNVKEHATLSAGARVDHGVEFETTEDHVNKAADRGCVSRLVEQSRCAATP
jgi:hypothetical protein